MSVVHRSLLKTTVLFGTNVDVIIVSCDIYPWLARMKSFYSKVVPGKNKNNGRTRGQQASCVLTACMHEFVDVMTYK